MKEDSLASTDWFTYYYTITVSGLVLYLLLIPFPCQCLNLVNVVHLLLVGTVEQCKPCHLSEFLPASLAVLFHSFSFFCGDLFLLDSESGLQAESKKYMDICCYFFMAQMELLALVLEGIESDWAQGLEGSVVEAHY